MPKRVIDKNVPLRQCVIGINSDDPDDRCTELLAHGRKSNICVGCERYLEDAAKRGSVWISKRQRQIGKWSNRLTVATPTKAQKLIKKADKKRAPLIVSDAGKVSSPTILH